MITTLNVTPNILSHIIKTSGIVPKNAQANCMMMICSTTVIEITNNMVFIEAVILGLLYPLGATSLHNQASAGGKT
jgi:hypothetical protein